MLLVCLLKISSILRIGGIGPVNVIGLHSIVVEGRNSRRQITRSTLAGGAQEVVSYLDT